MTETKKQLGDYLILDKIAHGGMAEIFKAKTADPTGIERLVVIKRILPHISSHPEYVDMLIDEAKIAVHFSHGNIAQIYDLGRVGEDYFIVMEYVDGKTLAQILKKFRDDGKVIPLEIIIYAMLEICRALTYIHAKTDADGKPLGVVHRDISPQNIILSYAGTVKVIDFGVAKSVDRVGHTESGVLKGKFAYMSPEQARGHAIDKRSDIFSAGILLWELLTQGRLFKRSSNKETIQAVLKYSPQAPSAIRPGVMNDLDQIVLKALRKRRWLRYQDASEMMSDLERVLMHHFPEFKPLEAIEFIYHHFGPENDEKGLPLEIQMPAAKIMEAKTKAAFSPLKSETTKKTPLGYLKSWVNLPDEKLIQRSLLLLGVVLVLSLTWWLLSSVLSRPSLSPHETTISSQPAGAEIYINDVSSHLNTPAILNMLELGREYRIGLSLEGYRFEEKTILFKAGRGNQQILIKLYPLNK